MIWVFESREGPGCPVEEANRANLPGCLHFTMASRQTIYLPLVVTIIANLLQPALAQVNITTSRCADPSAYTSCNADVNGADSACVAACNGSWSCLADCNCTTYQGYLNCMASACWNEVRLPSPCIKAASNHIPGLLLRIPEPRPAVPQRLSVRPRADPLLARPAQRPSRVLLQPRPDVGLHPQYHRRAGLVFQSGN